MEILGPVEKKIGIVLNFFHLKDHLVENENFFLKSKFVCLRAGKKSCASNIKDNKILGLSHSI